MFTTIIVQPIFNLLVLIYAIIPGHNFGLAIIIFTVLVRLLMWPLVKKQLHHTKAMKALQPELKKIKASAKGDKQKESAMTMALYKERNINPFSSLGLVIVQLPILIGLYSGLRRIINDPHEIISFSYPALHNLPWMKELATNIHHFDGTLVGLVDLTKPAENHGIYFPALIIVVASAFAQYFQSRQLLPQDKESRSLRRILGDAGKGKAADQQEVNAAVGQATQFFIPIFVLLIGLRLASALPLYWLAGSVVAYIQQARVLKEDVEESEIIASSPSPTPKKAVDSKVVKTKSTSPKKRSGSSQRKRRKR